MSYTAHPQTQPRVSDTGWHVITSIVAILGIAAAAIGAWIAFGTSDGTISAFGWSWDVSDVSDVWASMLMIGGGLVAALSLGVEAVRDFDGDTSRWIVGLETLVALVGVAAIVTGIVFLF